MNFLQRLFLFALFCISMQYAKAWTGQPVSQLHVDGKYLKDAQGNIVTLHGFAQTYSPWFNEQGTKWTNYDVSGCLKYNKGLIDSIMAKGWKMNFMRLHMDPYWSNTPGISVKGENDISAFSMSRFKTYLNSVFIPMAKYAISKGMYVVMRPPGVCPNKICLGDDYQKYLKQVWGYVANNSYLRNNPGIMYELANEPVDIVKVDEATRKDTSVCDVKDLHDYFQAIVDTMRQSCSNILWIPGTGYQSLYQAYGDYPIEGYNIGYAVHCYPGWYNGTGGAADVNYISFAKGWADQINPVGNVAPIMVTEMDWAPAKYNASWGKATTGTAGKTGFGANFKKIADDHKNVSWLFFTDAKYLAQYTNTAPADGDTCTFLNDPEACPWPCYHWYQDYSTVQQAKADYSCLSTADKGNGKFVNPVIQADFPDPDVIRVDDTYYMVTTSMHNFPGCTLLKSSDLVNWEYCANPLTKLSSLSEYNMEDNMNMYSKGSWANSLIYRDGTFYILFNAFSKYNHGDGGGYVLSATDPEGTWTLTKLSTGYYDPGLMVDDDGTTYVACGNTNIYVNQLDKDFNTVKSAVVISDFSSLEGNHMFKKDGYYYIYSTCAAYPANQWCFRSTSPFGPYEQKKVFDYNVIHQGAMIQTQGGEWWTMLMQDCGAYGRMPWLLPVEWSDNWPVIANNGTGVNSIYTKPNVGGSQYPITYLPTNDRFCNYEMGMQWQWNHNPDKSKFSLIERPGYLRLYTASVTDRMSQARNTLTQRIFGYHSTSQPSYGTVKMNVSHMNDGDVAGLAVFQSVYGSIAIKNNGGTKQLIWAQDTVTSESGVTPKSTTIDITTDSLIYLRAIANINTSKATFWYSTDNVTYTQLGDELSMVYNLDVFVGNRFAIFNYATKSEGGYVDVDWFTTEPTFEESTYYDDTFTGYSEETLTATSLAFSNSTLEIKPGTTNVATLTATFGDGHTEDVAGSAKYTVTGDNVTVSGGRITTTGIGCAGVTATYTDPMGNVLTAYTTVDVSFFPLSASNISTSISGSNSYDESTGTMTLSAGGQCGWLYTSGADMSDYKYLVMYFNEKPATGTKLFLYDANSSHSTTLVNSKQAVVSIQSLKKENSTTTLDLSDIRTVCFYNATAGTVSISDMYLTSNSDFSKPTTGMDETVIDGDALVDVYTITGVRVRSQVKAANATENLGNNVYIIKYDNTKNKKVVIF